MGCEADPQGDFPGKQVREKTVVLAGVRGQGLSQILLQEDHFHPGAEGPPDVEEAPPPLPPGGRGGQFQEEGLQRHFLHPESREGPSGQDTGEVAHPPLLVGRIVQAQFQGLRVRQGHQVGQKPIPVVPGPGGQGEQEDEQSRPQDPSPPHGTPPLRPPLGRPGVVPSAVHPGNQGRSRASPGFRIRTSASFPTRARKASGSAWMGGKVS